MRIRVALSVAIGFGLGALASCSSEQADVDKAVVGTDKQPRPQADVHLVNGGRIGAPAIVDGNLRAMDDYSVVTLGSSAIVDEFYKQKDVPGWSIKPELQSLGDSKRPEHIALSGVEAAHRLATSSETRTKAPVLLTRIGKPDLEELPLEALRVATVLTATRARTLVDMTFANESDRQLEGSLCVRLPDGASPCYLGVFQGTGPASKLLEDLSSLLPPALDSPALLFEASPKLAATAEWGALRPAHVVESEQGARVYESVTRRRIDPALMEWSGGNTFKARIFPIAAKGRKRVALIYDQPPLAANDRVIVPLAVPERLPAHFRLEVAVAKNAFERAVLMAGETETVLDTTDAFARTVCKKVPAGVGLVLATTPKNASVSAGFGTAVGVPGSLVHARVSPKVAPGGRVPTGSAVFLLDTSLSQRTGLAPLCGKLLRAILDRDTTIERYQVIGFDVAARPITAGWQSNTPASREQLSATVESLWLEGATNMAAALEAAEHTLAAGEHATFFLLSDAIASWGIEDPCELARAYPRAFSERWIAYAIGDRPVNHALTGALARQGGRVVHVLGGDALDAAATAHTSAPTLLKNVKVSGVAANHLVVAGAPTQLFPGEVLEVAFRTSDDPKRASVVLVTDKGAEELPLSGAEGPEPVSARAWADLTTTGLLELQDREADEVAVALSQRFALANRVASFLMLETDAEYKTREIKTEDLDLDALVAAAEKRFTARPSFAPRTDDLDAAALAFLESSKRASCAPWPRHVAPSRPAKDSFAPPKWPERIDPLALLAEAQKRFEVGFHEEALRVLSSIVEENPRDGPALRLVAFTLMGWERFQDAEQIFARCREVRPFEPQAYLGEALAVEAQGRLLDAALRYEIVLAGKFDRRYEQFAKDSAKRLYGRLLARAKDFPAAEERSKALKLERGADHELLLLWNLDDTDIDLHVIEDSGEEVKYDHRQSKSGGKLLWDNTAGLGPEIYRHAALAPRSAFVDYYSSLSVAGAAPAATLVIAFDVGDVRCRSSILANAKEHTTVFERPER